MTAARSHVFLSPGLFGFSRLGSYDYFCHVEAGLGRRFRDAGRGVRFHVVDAHPTSSVRRRAARLAEVVDREADGDGPIHLVGHSTGGLDARLLASPTVNVSGDKRPRAWGRRLRSVVTMNTPHFGTPLASFFATVSGHRLLAAISALTFVALRLGAPPLALGSALIAAFGRIDRVVGIELQLVERLVDRLVRLLDDASSHELRAYLHLLRGDQGAIIQLSPEAMDLFQAGVEDNPAVAYASTASYAPQPSVIHWARAALTPWSDLSAIVFGALHRLTALENATYPCGPPDDEADRALRRYMTALPPPAASDGVVPLRSQVRNDLIWVGLGDHLDVVGHFGKEQDPLGGPPHVDWLMSRSGFNRRRFDELLDVVASFLLGAEDRLQDAAPNVTP
jgi:triacylglycerol lipase